MRWDYILLFLLFRNILMSLVLIKMRLGVANLMFIQVKNYQIANQILFLVSMREFPDTIIIWLERFTK